MRHLRRHLIPALGLTVSLAAVPATTGVMAPSASASRVSHATSATQLTYLGYDSSPGTNAWIRGQIKIFETSHPGVTITVQYTTPTYIIEKIKTAVAAGEAPDIAQTLPGSAQNELFTAGKILNLTSYIDNDKQWLSWTSGWNVIPNTQYKVGNQIAADNVSIAPMYIWYYPSDLAKVGWTSFPTTIDGSRGLIALAAALKKSGIPTMALGLNSQSLFNYDYTFWTLEANFDPGGVKGQLADDGQYPWTSPIFVKAATLFKQLYQDGVFYPTALERSYEPDSETDFGDGKASMAWPFGTWLDTFYPAKLYSKMSAALFPSLNSTTPRVLTASNGLAYIVPIVTNAQKNPEHIRLVLAFLKQLNSPQSEQSIWRVGEISSDGTGATQGPAQLLKLQVELASSSFSHYKYAIDENTYSPATGSALDNGLEAVLSGSLTVTALLKQVAVANREDFACSPHCK
jgi:ABC-type glycerol-3-phosphate transport system substrate-binding protein